MTITSDSPHLTFCGHPLPDWVSEIRDHQMHAVQEILDAYARGVDMVVLDAPTGSGKTLIGELVRLGLRARVEAGGSTTGVVPAAHGLYICHGKSLQHQFVRDFDAPVLMGRANYPTVMTDELTAEDCEGQGCPWCPTLSACPYQMAKDAAIRGNPAVLNTAYFLSEANGPGRMSGRELVVVDECDTLEGELGRWAEFRVSAGQAAAFGLDLPRKAARWPTIVDFLRRYQRAVREAVRRETNPKKVRRYTARVNKISAMFLRGDVAEWVRIYEDGGGAPPLVLKPVMVNDIADRFLWRHASRWLLMSATVVGAEQMLEDLGWTRDYEVVHVPSSFPPENRPVYPLPLADMSRKGKERGEWERCARGVRLVLEHHPDERVLVHTVSYQLADLIVRACDDMRERLVTYRSAGERDEALGRYSQMGNGVLIAPSMDRGVDLPDDLCRVMVVAKLPMPYLGDQQVSARLRADGGDLWYTLSTIRSLVQMTGRGVRHAEDKAITYILDRGFLSNLGRYDRYLPDWWTEALVTDRRPSDVLPGIKDI